MAKPDTKNGFLKIANELWEAWMRTQLSPREEQVLKAIVRQTFGWRKKEARITYNKVSQLTNLPPVFFYLTSRML